MAIRTNLRSVHGVVVLCVVLWMPCVVGQKSLFFSNIPGDWCKTRLDPCCLQRQDDCSVPIFGTLCYCDEFCNREENPDCCPDYTPVCLGITPKPPAPLTLCSHADTLLQLGDVVSDNCNSCECQADGTVSCTSFKCLSDSSLLQQLGAGDQLPNRWGWSATNYSIFWGRRLEDGVLHRTGTEDTENTLYPIFLEYDPSSIPRNFDARTVWRRRISRVRDQGWCGSSWAFSTIAVATDRLAIESEGVEAVPLSPQNLISCDRRVQQGCEGGKIERAWQYLRRYGVVDEDCYPYTSGQSLAKEQCKVSRRMDFTTVQCDTSEQLSVGRKSLYKMEPAYRIRSRESDIQFEILSNGPVQAKMRVEQDFFAYRSGVYSSSGLSDPYVVGHHSVRLIGWGEEFSSYNSQPVKYWLAANSWGEEWGERGFFKIRRGVNESGIEENILSVRARLLTHYPPGLSLEGYSQWFYD